jgi:4-amino-4-deoxy-L-arabinose transferase-like glycosyltransferase
MPTVPAGIKSAIVKKAGPRGVQAAMLAKFDEPGFLLTVRRLYIVFSALAIVWVWAAVVALRRPYWEAAVAAACIGLSWEFAYHARWVAVDCPLVQFSALTLFMLALYFRGRRPVWLYAAAAAAGLATGTKYQGAVLLLSVVLAGALTMPVRPVRTQAIRIVALSVLALAAFLITTPNTVFEPFATVEELLRISRYYEAGHWGHTVTGMGHHLRLVMLYLSVSLFSPYQAAALTLFAFAIAGTVFLVRSDRRLGVVLLSFPIVFLLLFCFKYHTMIVRNYLLVLPFLALFAARGLSGLGELLPRPWLRWILAGAVSVAFVAGGVWLVSAGESIRHIDPNSDLRKALAYVSKHPRIRFRLSPQVMALVKEQKLQIPPNAQAEAAGAQQIVFFPRADAPDGFGWRSNDPWFTKAIFGPREVNFNWYTAWMAHDRIVVMTMEKAKTTAGQPLVK